MFPPPVKAGGVAAFSLIRRARGSSMDEFGRLREAAKETEADRIRAQRWARLLSGTFLALACLVFVIGLTLTAAAFGPRVGLQLPLEDMGLLGEIAASIASSLPAQRATAESPAAGSEGQATLALPSPLPSATPTATASATTTITPTETLLYTYTPTATATPSATRTPTRTPSRTPTPGPTFTPSPTVSGTPPTPTSEPSPTETGFPGCEPSGNAGFHSALLDLINGERDSQGLPAYSRVTELQAAALRHSTDMACNALLSHTGSDGSSVGERATAQGYTWSSIGENIFATGITSSEAPQLAFDWWMASAPNRANLLSAEFTEIGIGYTYEPSSPFGGYFAVVFARP